MGLKGSVEIREEVGLFAVEMEEKLRARDKYNPTGWSQDTVWSLLDRLHDKFEELEESLGNLDSEELSHSLAVDIGNFAMMIADKNRESEVKDVELTMSGLEKIFKRAIENNAEYVAVAVEFDEADDVEVIINTIENAEYKLKYYKESYNFDLTHKYAKGVKILAVAFGDSFEEIEVDLLDK